MTEVRLSVWTSLEDLAISLENGLSQADLMTLIKRIDPSAADEDFTATSVDCVVTEMQVAAAANEAEPQETEMFFGGDDLRYSHWKRDVRCPRCLHSSQPTKVALAAYRIVVASYPMYATLVCPYCREEFGVYVRTLNEYSSELPPPASAWKSFDD